jgi:hypothetical protein
MLANILIQLKLKIRMIIKLIYRFSFIQNSTRFSRESPLVWRYIFETRFKIG